MKKPIPSSAPHNPAAPPRERGASRTAHIGIAAFAVVLLALLIWGGRGRFSHPRVISPTAPVNTTPVDPAEARLRQVVAQQPRSAAAHAELGRYSLSLARPVSAIWELQEARSLGMDDASLRADLAKALASAGQRTLAISELRALLKEHPGETGARRQLAELLLATGQPAEAAALLRDLPKGDDNPAETALLIGRADHVLGQLPQAEAAFRRYAALASPGTARFQPLGRFLLATGRPEAARQVLMQDQKVAFRTADFHYLLGLTYLRARPHPDLGKASAAFTFALQFDPKHPQARTALGEVLEQQGAWAQAMAQYQEAIQRDPEQVEPHARLSALLRKIGQTATSLEQQGIAASLQDQLPAAESAFRQMMQASHADLAAIQSFIVTCVAMKRVDRSRPAVEALRQRPFEPGTADLVARLYLATGSRALARKLAEEWGRQQPQAAALLRRRGQLAIDDLRVSEGIGLYEQAWAREPQNADTAASLGLAWERVPSRANLEKAAEWLQRATALAPANPRFQNDLAEVLRQLGRWDASRDAYLRALALDPSLAAAYNGLVSLAQATSQPDQARLFAAIVRAGDTAARETERLHQRAWDAPEDAETRLALAGSLLRSGQPVKARGHVDAALERRPGWERALALRRQIDALLVWA